MTDKGEEEALSPAEKAPSRTKRVGKEAAKMGADYAKGRAARMAIVVVGLMAVISFLLALLIAIQQSALASTLPWVAGIFLMSRQLVLVERIYRSGLWTSQDEMERHNDKRGQIVLLEKLSYGWPVLIPGAFAALSMVFVLAAISSGT